MVGKCKKCGYQAGIFNLKNGVCKSCSGKSLDSMANRVQNDQPQPTGIGSNDARNSLTETGGGFAIYSKGSYIDSEQYEYQAVKNGFSWPALFFGPIWAWVKGMVGVGFGLLGLAIFVNVIGKILQFGTHRSAPIVGLFFDWLITLGVAIWIGSSGNKWRKSSLEKEGYKLVQANAPGSSPPEAILAYKEGVSRI